MGTIHQPCAWQAHTLPIELLPHYGGGISRTIRTLNLLIRIQALYPIELWKHISTDGEVRSHVEPTTLSTPYESEEIHPYVKIARVDGIKPP